MNKLCLEIRKQQRGLILVGAILQHDNSSAHESHLVSSTIHNSKYKLLHHPPYSPDLIPSDNFLFPVLKDYLKRRHYNDRSLLGSSTHQCLKMTSQWLYNNFQNVAKVYLS